MTFTDSSFDTGGTIVSWSWEFGDGSTSTTQTADHTYATAGTYPVNLKVTDKDGFKARTTRSLTVKQGNKPPVASFSVDPKKGVVPLTVEFDAAGSSDPDGTISTWSWTFEDGSTDSGVSVSHIYTVPGTYTATLTVTDNDGATAIDTTTINAQTDAEAISDVVMVVESYGLLIGIETGLTDKLDSAITALNEDNGKMAINNLNAFIRFAKAQQGKKLTVRQATTLITEAHAIIASIRA